MKKIFILALIVALGYMAFAVQTNGLSLQMAAAAGSGDAVGVAQGANPKLEEKTVDGKKALEFTAKINIKNNTTQDKTVNLSDPSGSLGELSKVVKKQGWAQRFGPSYEVVTAGVQKKVSLMNDASGEVYTGTSVTVKSKTSQVYTIKIVIDSSSLADGSTYAMRLHGPNGGYVVSSTTTNQAFTSISKTYSNTVELKPATPIAQVNPKPVDLARFVPKLDGSYSPVAAKAGTKYEIRIAGYRGKVGATTVRLKVSKDASVTSEVQTIATLKPNEDVFMWDVPKTLYPGVYYITMEFVGDTSGITLTKESYPLMVKVENTTIASPASGTLVKVEKVSASISEYDESVGTYGLNAKMRIRLQANDIIDVASLKIGVIFSDEKGQNEILVSAKEIKAVNGSSIIQKGESREVEFIARTSGTSLTKGKTYKASLFDMSWTSVAGGPVKKADSFTNISTGLTAYTINPDRTRAFVQPAEGATWKRGTTVNVTLSGYLKDIIKGEKFMLYEKSGAALRDQYNGGFIGAFEPGQTAYSFVIPKTLIPGEYKIRINGSSVIESKIFKITE